MQFAGKNWNFCQLRSCNLPTGDETGQNADNSTANFSVQRAGVANAEAGIRVAQANIAAQAATVQRLQSLVGFERVIALFDGVVTARSVDTGDLVSADQNGGTSLFSIDHTGILPVQVCLPQSVAIGLHDGLDADVHVPEIPAAACTAGSHAVRCR